MKVFFIRHGQTEANVRGVYAGGGLDVPVSEAGLAEAREVSRSRAFRAVFDAAFGGKPVPLVYVSPMQRAQQTAAILFPGAAQEIVEDLREFKFGAFEGRVYGELKEDPLYTAWQHGGEGHRCPPDGDSVATCTARVSGAFAAIARARFAARDDAPIVLVSHGAAAMAFLHAFIDKEKPFFTWETPNCGVWQFDCVQGPDGEPRLTVTAPPSGTDISGGKYFE